MGKPPPNWPPAALPRVLDEKCAAFYCHMTVSGLREMVSEGLIPEPAQRGRHRLYDRFQLDKAIDVETGNLDPIEAGRRALDEGLGIDESGPA